jgi:hypothetical protein
MLTLTLPFPPPAYAPRDAGTASIVHQTTHQLLLLYTHSPPSLRDCWNHRASARGRTESHPHHLGPAIGVGLQWMELVPARPKCLRLTCVTEKALATAIV